MDFPTFVVALVLLGCLTRIVTEGMRTGFFSNWQGVRQGSLADEVRRLGGALAEQQELLRTLQGRLENLESVVTSAEFQAAQRISRGMDAARVEREQEPARAGAR